MIGLGIANMKAERRQSGGTFNDAVVRLLEAQAAGTAADISSTSAVECAAGSLSRALSMAAVSGPSWAAGAISPAYLGQVGRDLVRRGQSLHVVDVSSAGRVSLLPFSSWHFEGDSNPSSWRVRATTYGPSSSTTRLLPYSAVVFLAWGKEPGQPYTGIPPTRWASTTARLQSEIERSMADESGGPITQLIAIPQDGGDGSDTDPLAQLKADIRTARGKAAFVETTAAGWGEGGSAAPRKDWSASRLGPEFAPSMPEVLGQSFTQMLAACGMPPGMFLAKASDAGQREAYRRWFALVVQPIARLLAAELSAKLEADIKLDLSGLFAHDLAGRARAFSGMVQGGMEVSKAAALSGLMEAD